MAIDRVRVNEGSSKTVSFTLLDHDGDPVQLSSIEAAQLTLYDLETYEHDASPIAGILNGRDGQDVLNANDVTIHATSGLVSWVIQPEDNVIVTERRQLERHRALFRFLVGTAALDYEIEVEVLNLRAQA